MTSRHSGFVLPVITLAALLVVGAGLYYYHHEHPEVDTVVSSATTATTTTVYTYYTDTSSSSPATTTAYRTVERKVTRYVPVRTTTYSAGIPNTGVAYGSSNAALVEVRGDGVMPQRLGWQTYTNIPYSFALSRPGNWSVSGSDAYVTQTDGHAVVAIQAFDIVPGTTAVAFANAHGATGGFITTQVNAYTALQTTEGANTAYYIVNGAVGYKITVSNNLTAAEREIVRATLVEFTVTKQR